MMNRGVLATIILIATLGFAFMVLVPKVQEVKAINIEKQAKIRVAANKQARLTALEQLNTTFTNEAQRVSTIISTLPNTAEVPELLITVEAMANQSRINLQSIFPQVNEKQQQVSLTLVGEGELSTIEELMRSIGDNNRPMSVSSFSLVKASGKNLSFNIVVTAPFVAGDKDSES